MVKTGNFYIRLSSLDTLMRTDSQENDVAARIDATTVPNGV